MEEITKEDKIEYIYQTLKNQETRYKRSLYFKWLFRIFILMYLYYFITTGLPNLLSDMMPSINIFGEQEESSNSGSESIDTLMLERILEEYFDRNN